MSNDRDGREVERERVAVLTEEELEFGDVLIELLVAAAGGTRHHAHAHRRAAHTHRRTAHTHRGTAHRRTAHWRATHRGTKVHGLHAPHKHTHNTTRSNTTEHSPHTRAREPHGN